MMQASNAAIAKPNLASTKMKQTKLVFAKIPMAAKPSKQEEPTVVDQKTADVVMLD